MQDKNWKRFEMIAFLKKLFGFFNSSHKLMPESLYEARVDDAGLACIHPEHGTQAVRWDDLREVLIVTNDEGPFFCDVFWHFNGDTSECVIPQGATGEGQVIDALQRLDGFDYEQMFKAMTSVENKQFLCWRRNGKEQSAVTGNVMPLENID